MGGRAGLLPKAAVVSGFGKTGRAIRSSRSERRMGSQTERLF